MAQADKKAVVLTYHRVPSGLSTAKFHDVPFDQFKEQMTLIAQREAASPNTYITFDDGTDDHAVAGALLHEMGLRGVFFIITGRLDQKGYLTSQQVVHLARQGHRIGSHGISHRHFPSLDSSELDEELASSKSFLEELTGTTVDWIAPPGGVYNRTVLERALQLGYRVFRTMDWGYSSLPLSGRVVCLPVFRKYDLTAFERILDGKAPLWRYKAKNILKVVLGERIYIGMRDRFTG